MAIIGISGHIGSGKDTVGKIIELLTDKSVTENEIIEIIKGEILYDNIQSDWKIKKFAGKLKQIVSILTGIPVKDLEKQEVKNRVLGEEWWYYRHNVEHKRISIKEFERINSLNMYLLNSHYTLFKPTVRQLLQEVGTEAMRNQIHPNIWINSLFVDYKIRGKVEAEDKIASDGGYYTQPGYKGHYPNWIITDMRFPNELKAVKDRGGITIRVNRPVEIIAQHQSFLENHPANHPKSVIIGEHPSETSLDSANFDYIIDNNSDLNTLIQKVKTILKNEKII